jgi:hypothetical protein
MKKIVFLVSLMHTGFLSAQTPCVGGFADVYPHFSSQNIIINDLQLKQKEE